MLATDGHGLSFKRARDGRAPRSVLVALALGTLALGGCDGGGAESTAGGAAPRARAGRTALRPATGSEGLPLAASPSSPAFDPPWAAASVTSALVLERDAQLSDEQNGAALVQAVRGLQAGERLAVGGGTWSVDSLFTIDLQGTAERPIWIVAKPGETPVLTRPDARQNALNVGSRAPARFLCLRGLELTGGDTGIKLYDAANVWIDRCHVHHVGGAGVAANSADTAHLFLTRNVVHDTAGTGEGFYLGANHSAHVMRSSVVALNHVHDTGGSQGDGIELKQGSYDNWIVGNLVHDTPYPCILAYGTGGRAPNRIERNVCYGSSDNVLQVQGEALVRNNLLIGGRRSFSSHDHQGQSRDLVFVHNTILNTGRGAHLQSWNGRPGMVFANNAVYSRSGDAIRFAAGSSGVTVVGNVVLGRVVGSPSGWVAAAGLTDFADVSWDGTRRDARPVAGGALIGSGERSWAVALDLTGAARVGALESGCMDAP